MNGIHKSLIIHYVAPEWRERGEGAVQIYEIVQHYSENYAVNEIDAQNTFCYGEPVLAN